MKRLSSALALAIAVLVLTSGNLSAGVVMAETSLAKGPNGKLASQDKTVYVQGNKQKVELGGVAQITDLDKNVVYIVNKHDRVYAELPLRVPAPLQPDRVNSEVVLKKTGQTRVIANHSCSEYRTAEGNEVERVSISACVSTDAPGAKELSGFARNITTRLKGQSIDRPTPNRPEGLMLEKQSVLSFRVPDSSPGRAFRTASYLVETRVNKITLQQLPAETFNPPAGYSRLQHPGSTGTPADLPLLMSSI
jgi:hypothetical protein